jgi:hypothetical protein
MEYPQYNPAETIGEVKSLFTRTEFPKKEISGFYELSPNLPDSFAQKLQETNQNQGILYGLTGDCYEAPLIEIKQLYPDIAFITANTAIRSPEALQFIEQNFLKNNGNPSYVPLEAPLSREDVINVADTALLYGTDPYRYFLPKLLASLFEKLKEGGSLFASGLIVKTEDIANLQEFYSLEKSQIKVSSSNYLPKTFRQAGLSSVGLCLTRDKETPSPLSLPQKEIFQILDGNNFPAEVKIPSF